MYRIQLIQVKVPKGPPWVALSRPESGLELRKESVPEGDDVKSHSLQILGNRRFPSGPGSFFDDEKGTNYCLVLRRRMHSWSRQIVVPGRWVTL